jgi:hypothetical protein
MKKIIVITTDDGSREDANVYYSRFLIVESDKLTFSEPIFHKQSGLPGDKIILAIQSLGYTVEEPEPEYVIEDLRNEEDEEDEDEYLEDDEL